MNRKSKVFILELVILVVISSLYRVFLLGLFWMILHELAHILVGKLYNVTPYRVYIHLTGVSAEVWGVDELLDKQKILIYISGPLTNLFFAIILFLLSYRYNNSFINYSININLVLGMFNLIPAYPLDGSRVAEIIFGRKLLYKRTKNILIKESFFISGIFIILFISSIYIHKANISLLLTAILIIYSTYIERKSIMYIIMGNLYRKRIRLKKLDYIENKNISIYYKCSLVKAMSLVDKNRFNSFFILNEGLKVLAIIYEDELIEALKKYGNISFNEYLKYRK